MNDEISCEPKGAELESLSRRKFLGYWAGALSTAIVVALGTPLVGMFIAPLFTKQKDVWLKIGSLSDVRPGSPARFTYRYTKMDGWFEKTVHGTVYAVLDQSGSLFILSNICSHLGCGVRWDPDKKAFLCPCHNGVYGIDGKVISGPPPRPLTRWGSRISNGQIEIRIKEV